MISTTIGSNNFKELKALLSSEQKQFIKKIFFPHKKIYDQHDELIFKKKGYNISITPSVIELSNGKTLKKYKLNSGFYLGIHHKNPGSGYIDFFKDSIIILSARGILAYKNDLLNDVKDFVQIKNNIETFINSKQYAKSKSFSLKDLSIFDNKIYISYTEEIKEDCWNTSVIFGEFNLKNIKFKKLFSPKECLIGASGNQAGGRIVKFDEEHILLSIGDYQIRNTPQDKQSVNGKLLRINIKNSDYEIISMGHRNPQGLLYDKEANIVLETEHGPRGGDEINLIKINEINKKKILNYGWAISSYGEHYGNPKKNVEKYKQFPLYKSHKNYGFIEPLRYFVPSIAISEIVKIDTKRYAFGSMGTARDGDKSIYFFELDNANEIINFYQLKVFERVRDLKFNNNKLYLFMENTASIGIIDLID